MTEKSSKENKKISVKIPKSTRFEDALTDLEKVVQTLESGEQPLDKSLEQFERGIALARFCQQSLTDAEQKVKILLGDDKTAELKEFDESA